MNMKTDDKIKSVEVFAGTIMEAEMVKSFLENAEIEAYLINENTGTMAPWYTAPGGMGAVKIVVSSLDSEHAKQVVEEYERNINIPDQSNSNDVIE